MCNWDLEKINSTNVLPTCGADDMILLHLRYQQLGRHDTNYTILSSTDKYQCVVDAPSHCKGVESPHIRLATANMDVHTWLHQILIHNNDAIAYYHCLRQSASCKISFAA